MSLVLIGRLGAVLTVLGIVAVATLLFGDTHSFLNRKWRDYTQRLQRHASFLMLDVTGAQIAKAQVAACLLFLLLFALAEQPLLLFLFALAAVAPTMILDRMSTKRIELIEKQLDTWLLLMGNALKATGSIGEAIESSTRMLPPPLGKELEVVLKEMQFGSSLHKAVLNMSHRIGSRTVNAAMSAILIGQRTGGDLPQILEESSAVLREMGRLEGMIRAKMAEGRAQLTVMGAAPFGILGMIYALNREWLAPLFQNAVGYAIIGGAVVLWLASVLIARKILAIQA